MDSPSSSGDDSDHRRDMLERYSSLSADVSESENDSPATCTPLAPSSPAGPLFSSNSELPTPSQITRPVPVFGRGHVIIPAEKANKLETSDLSEVELMKEMFAKLLLGEDMSGGGNGVCTALAISNAITNLSDTVFQELWKLEPLAPERKSLWRREMEWILSVSDSIVELIPSLQELPGGGTFEIMVTRPRSDLYVNLPALRKLDATVITLLDRFSESEFYYVDRGVVVAGGEKIEPNAWSQHPQYSEGSLVQLEEKWWLPFPKVPPNGLGDDTVQRLRQCRECSNQIFKAAWAINNSVLSEMEIPKAYLESLPKSGKACLGETLYRYITSIQFSPECLLDYLEISSEYTTLEIANRIEAAMHIWRQRFFNQLNHGKSGRSSWTGTLKGFVGDAEKNKILSRRAEILLQNLKSRFPGLPQTALDINKIQSNKDIGHSILESYSRMIESLAFNLIARIDDLLYVDNATKQRAVAEQVSKLALRGSSASLPLQKPGSPHFSQSRALPLSC